VGALLGGDAVLPTKAEPGARLVAAEAGDGPWGRWQLVLHHAPGADDAGGAGLCFFLQGKAGGTGRCVPPPPVPPARSRGPAHVHIPGPDRQLRTYPVRDPGLCMPAALPEGSPFPALTNGGGSPGRPFVVSGTVMPDVRRLTVDGPGGRHDVPISPHRGFLLGYAPSARGRATLTAVLADGSTAFQLIEVGATLA